jgi:hypothetical protein
MAQLEHGRSIELLYLALCVGRPREGEQHDAIWSSIKHETLDAMLASRAAGETIAPDTIRANLSARETKVIDGISDLRTQADVSDDVFEAVMIRIGTLAGSIEFRVGLSTEIREARAFDLGHTAPRRGIDFDKGDK